MDSGHRVSGSIIFTLIFNFVFTSAQLTNGNCGNQTVYIHEDFMDFPVPQHDGPRECIYKIASDNDTIMAFKIISISIGMEENNCDNDYITVGDVGIALPHQRYTACGIKPPNWKFFSTGNQMTVKLLIASSLNNVFVSASINRLTSNNKKAACGRRLIRVGTGRTEFSFPQNSIKEEDGVICQYLLLGNNSGNGNMAFSFQSIYIQDKDNCESDYVFFMNETDEISDSYCGTITPRMNVTTEGNTLQMTVRIQTDVANGSFRGYIYHEMFEPIQASSKTTPTRTVDKTTTTDGTNGESGQLQTIYELTITIVLLLITWNH